MYERLPLLIGMICAPGAHQSQEIVSDALKVKLQIAMNHHLTTETQVWVLCKGSKCP